MENVGEDILLEILVRTSEKDAVRCKCVCKLWNRVISQGNNSVLLRRFWPNSPISGIYFLTLKKYLFGNSTQYYIDFIVSLGEVKDIKYVPLHPCVSETEEFLSCFYVADCCNGLQLLFDPGLYDPNIPFHYAVFNPITKQKSCIPVAVEHSITRGHGYHFLVALAFDPTESLHYRIVRMGYPKPMNEFRNQIGPDASAVVDLFSSETGQWVRHHIQLGNVFTQDSALYWRHYTYFRGVLYWMVSSSTILCLDLNNLAQNPIRHLSIPYTACKRKIASILMLGDELHVFATRLCSVGCVGVSMNHLYHCRRIRGHSRKLDALCVWFYDGNADGHVCGGEWVLKFKVYYRRFLRRKLWVEPMGVSPNADVLFIGTNDGIFSYHLESEKLELLYDGAPERRVVDCSFFPLFMSRKSTCLVQLHNFGEESALSITPI